MGNGKLQIQRVFFLIGNEEWRLDFNKQFAYILDIELNIRRKFECYYDFTNELI